MRLFFRYSLLSILFVFLLGEGLVYGQKETKRLEGIVSFTTTQNVYIRFKSTTTVTINDTIYVTDGNTKKACLLLIEKSSVSCIAERIGDCLVQKGDTIIYLYKEKENVNLVDVELPNLSEKTSDTILSNNTADSLKIRKQEIDGRISVANYVSSGNGNANNRTIARLSLNAKNILGSKFSFFSYSNYRYNAISKNRDIRNINRLNVYEFALQYDLDSNTTISLGRKINRRMFSIGATDGLQAEKRWKKGFVGIVAGSKPDPYTYGLNFNLLQYGGYIGMYHNKSSSSTVGIVDQKNNGLTDRRYAFLQHNSSIGKNLSIYSTLEADLYGKDILGITTNNLTLRSFYLSLNYRITKKLRLMVSYDARKNVILYESYASNLETLTTNDPLRSGYRFRLNYRINKDIYTGGGVNVRTQSDKKNNFTNVNAFMNFNNVLEGRWSNSLNINKNTYFQYTSFTSRYTKRFLDNNLSLAPNIRFIRYAYINFDITAIKQVYLGVDAYYDVKKDISIGAMYDFSKRSGVGYHRFNINLIKRF